MLKGIPPVLSPGLLKALSEMGHGDELIIADGNFPCCTLGRDSIVIRLDGQGTADVLDAVLQVIPLDSYTEKPVALPEVVPGDPCPTPVIRKEYDRILHKYEPDHCGIEKMERYAFYERAKKAYLIIATGETALYANILLRKGVVKF